MKWDVEVRHCRALLAVEAGRSLTGGARLLGIAQSTLSETLLALERIIGEPVTVRRPGKDSLLTPAAIALLPHARMLVALSEEMSGQGQSIGRKVLKLGTVESISSYLLPAAITASRKLSPAIDVQVSIGLCDELRASVNRMELDVALTLEGGSCPAGSEDLVQVQLVPTIARSHHMVGRQIRRHELRELPFVFTDARGTFVDLVDAWLGTTTGVSPRFGSAGSIDAVKRAIVGQGAVGVLPDYALTDDLFSGEMAALDIADPLPAMYIRLTLGPKRQADDLINLLREEIPQEFARLTQHG